MCMCFRDGGLAYVIAKIIDTAKAHHRPSDLALFWLELKRRAAMQKRKIKTRKNRAWKAMVTLEYLVAKASFLWQRLGIPEPS